MTLILLSFGEYLMTHEYANFLSPNTLPGSQVNKMNGQIFLLFMRRGGGNSIPKAIRQLGINYTIKPRKWISDK